MKQHDAMGGFSKGLAVINAFKGSNNRLSISQVALKAELDRAATRRCLLTLLDEGYASHDGKFFSLTPQILRLGHSYLSSAQLPAIVQPYLDALLEQTDHSATLSVLDGTDVVVVARAAAKPVLSIHLAPGSRLPAYATATGRVLLAALPAYKAEALLRTSDLRPLTNSTTTDVASLLANLESVRERGYSLIDQELESGLCALAIPIEDSTGKTIASLILSAHPSSVTAAQMVDRYLPALLNVRNELRECIR